MQTQFQGDEEETLCKDFVLRDAKTLSIHNPHIKETDWWQLGINSAS